MSTDELLRQTSWLHRLARRLVTDAATADDLVQDTVTDALRQRPRGLRDLRAWLAAVLQRRAGRLRQRERQRPTVERQAARAEALPAADDTVATAMLHRDLVDAVLALAEPYRTTILLHYLRELPVAEVAARTGVPLATARSRVQRGLAQLRERLDRRHGGRAVWVTLVPATAIVPPLTTAMLLMNAKHLTALAASCVIVATAWWWFQRADPTLGSTTPARVGQTPITATATLEAPDAPVADREPVAATPPPATAPRVRATASGIALDEQTRLPVPDVEVSWLVALGDAETPPFRTRTDATGRFVLECDTAYPDNALNLLFVTNDHAHVQRTLFDVESRPGPAGVPDFDVGTVLLAPGTGLQGRVVDAHGHGVADAELLFYDRYWHGTRGRSVMLGQPLVIGRTAADGTFAPQPRVLPAQDAVLVAASARGLGWLVLTDLTRSRSERHGLLLRLAPTASLQATVVDRAGQPVVGAEIIAEPRFDPIGFAGRHPAGLGRVPSLRSLFLAHTDRTGMATLPHLPLGTTTGYTITARAQGHLDTLVERQLATGDNLLRLLLSPPRTITVTGSITDDQERPLGGAIATIRARGSENATELTADASGRFAGELRLVHPALHVKARGNGAESEQTIDVLPDQDRVELRFRLAAAAPITGVVVDEHDQPLPDVVVFLGNDPIATDARGRFTTPPRPLATPTSLRALPPGESSEWEPVETIAARPGDSPVTIRLRRLAAGQCRLVVELIAADGSPLEARRATLLREGGRWHPTQLRIGEVTALGLGPAVWHLEVETMHGHGFREQFQVAAGATEHHLRLQQGHPASVTVELVTEPEDLPLPAELRLVPADRTHGRLVVGDGQAMRADGWFVQPSRSRRFVVTDLAPGRVFELRIENDTLSGSARGSVRGDGDDVLQLRVRRSGFLRFQTEVAWTDDGLRLFVAPAGAAFGRGEEIGGLAGRTSFRWQLEPGTWSWRLETLPDSTGAARSWSGQAVVPPGEAVAAPLRGDGRQ